MLAPPGKSLLNGMGVIKAPSCVRAILLGEGVAPLGAKGLSRAGKEPDCSPTAIRRGKSTPRARENPYFRG